MEETPNWLNVVLALIIPVTAFAATLVSSNSWYGKVIDAIAFNWGKAKNDPSEQ